MGSNDGNQSKESSPGCSQINDFPWVLITINELPGYEFQCFVQKKDRNRKLEHHPPFVDIKGTDGEHALRDKLFNH